MSASRQDSIDALVGSVTDKTTFNQDVDIDVDEPIPCASISPSGRDVVLAS
jgi:hypothetical protein